MKSYCLKCNKESEMIVTTILIQDAEKEIKGRCKICNEYLCRIIITDSGERII